MESYEARFDLPANVQAVAGYQVIQLTALGMENAGRDLDTDSFVAGLEQIQGYTDMFGSAPVSFGPTRRLAAETTFLNQVQGGRWVRLTEPLAF